jgi:2'-5' RNA ligase
MENVISIWLQPQPNLKSEIFKIIKSFSKKYKVYSDLNGYKGPHITVLEIHSNKQDFKGVIRVIKDVSNNIKPFKLEINGIGHFMKKDATGKHNFVIYLRVKENKQLIKLKHMVDKEFPRESLRNKDRKFAPHITITHRELDKENFYRALKDYKNLEFVRDFIVDRIVISKRDIKTGKITVNKIILKNSRFLSTKYPRNYR